MESVSVNVVTDGSEFGFKDWRSLRSIFKDFGVKKHTSGLGPDYTMAYGTADNVDELGITNAIAAAIGHKKITVSVTAKTGNRVKEVINTTTQPEEAPESSVVSLLPLRDKNSLVAKLESCVLMPDEQCGILAKNEQGDWFLDLSNPIIEQTKGAERKTAEQPINPAIIVDNKSLMFSQFQGKNPLQAGNLVTAMVHLHNGEIWGVEKIITNPIQLSAIA